MYVTAVDFVTRARVLAPRTAVAVQIATAQASAEVLTARQAHDGRLVRSLHEPEELLGAAQELARSFVVGRSPVALGLAKQLLYAGTSAASPLEMHRADSLDEVGVDAEDVSLGLRQVRDDTAAQEDCRRQFEDQLRRS